MHRVFGVVAIVIGVGFIALGVVGEIEANSLATSIECEWQGSSVSGVVLTLKEGSTCEETVGQLVVPKGMTVEKIYQVRGGESVLAVYARGTHDVHLSNVVYPHFRVYSDNGQPLGQLSILSIR